MVKKSRRYLIKKSCVGAALVAARNRELLDIYKASVYEAMADGRDLRLRIGRRCAALIALQKSCRAASALYITAWNPRGRLQSRALNVQVNRRLERDLHRLTKHVWYGAGHSRDWSWEEESFLALGVTLRDSKRLGRKYRQVAIVWVGRTGVPRIVKTL